MASGSRPLRLLVAALGALALWTLLLLQLPLFFGRFPRRPQVVDFANYLTAARVGLEHGWSRIYDPALQAPIFLRLTGLPRFELVDTFVSPPPVAWLVAPLSWLSLDDAYWTWTALSAAALGFACWRVLPWSGLAGAVALLVGAGLYPVLIALQFGQVTPLVAAAVALAWWELRQGRQSVAALLLLPVVLKPQVGVLVPPALLLAGYRRCFLAWCAGAVAITAAAAVSLGASGIAQYLADLRAEQAYLDNQVWTLALLLGPGAAATAAEAACAGVALLTAWRAGRGRLTVAIVAGSLGSLLGAGYHHSIDFPALLPLALIQMRELPARLAAPFGVAGVAACYATPRLGPAPLLLLCLAWLGCLAAAAAWPSRLPAAAPLPTQTAGEAAP